MREIKKDDRFLVVDKLSKTFFAGTEDEKKALDDISFQLEKGDFVSIIGANGAGKSTLFNVISGSLTSDSGSISLEGQLISNLAEHKRAKFIGRLFQDPMTGTAADMTIEENLALALGKGSWLSLITKEQRSFIKEKLSLLKLNLENKMNTKVGQLSGGQRQALTLLMATINPPKLLLLDEHTAALDPATSEKVLELTDKIIKEGNLTCLMITHNMQSAIDFGNRLFMMDEGKIITAIGGSEKKKLTTEDLLRSFKEKKGHSLTNDRMLLL